MRKEFRLCIVMCMLIAATLTGCATVTSTPFKSVEPQAGKALVYVFRPESFMSRSTILEVDINNEKRGLLINNSYLPLYAGPGTFEIGLFTNGMVKNKYDSMILKDAKAGQAYYIKAEPSVFGAFTLKRLDTDSGLAEIRPTDYYQTR